MTSDHNKSRSLSITLSATCRASFFESIEHQGDHLLELTDAPFQLLQPLCALLQLETMGSNRCSSLCDCRLKCVHLCRRQLASDD